MEESMVALLPEDTFRFSCSKAVPCFNECCRDLNQFLFPYDIVRLKNRLAMSSAAFLEQYTTLHTGPETSLPVITLKPTSDSDLRCPFVTPSGCSVYEDRPASCRMYPLARVLSRSRETGEITEQYMLLREPHCLGFQQEKTQTVNEWIQSQGIAIYNEMNDMMMEIIALKNKFLPGPLDIRTNHLFYMACYDLDTFKDHAIENKIFSDMDMDEKTLELALHDDTTLLKLSLAWIRQTLFELTT
jgi:hypothetical protein